MKSSDSTNKRLFSNSQKKTTRQSQNFPKKNQKPRKKVQKIESEKCFKLPNYLKNVQSRIKREVEFHKRLFKVSQRSPDFQIREDFQPDDKQMINEFITFGSANENPSPINENQKEMPNSGNLNNYSDLNISNNFIPFNNNNNNVNVNDNNNNSNIMEIANSFLKSPFMHFVEGKNKIVEISNINFHDFDASQSSKVLKKSKSPYNTSDVFADLTQKLNNLNNLNKDLNIPKKDNSSLSNLIKIEQMSEGDSISSTFSMMPTNEELQAFFKREFCFNLSKNNSTTRGFANERSKRESDIGKIVSVRREREINKENNNIS